MKRILTELVLVSSMGLTSAALAPSLFAQSVSGPGYLWTDTYTASSKNAIVTCANVAQRALSAEHWGALTNLNTVTAASALEGLRGGMRARVICILSTLPPNNVEGFTAIIIVHGNATGVQSTGQELKRRIISLSPQARYTY